MRKVTKAVMIKFSTFCLQNLNLQSFYYKVKQETSM